MKSVLFHEIGEGGCQVVSCAILLHAMMRLLEAIFDLSCGESEWMWNVVVRPRLVSYDPSHTRTEYQKERLISEEMLPHLMAKDPTSVFFPTDLAGVLARSAAVVSIYCVLINSFSAIVHLQLFPLNSQYSKTKLNTSPKCVSHFPSHSSSLPLCTLQPSQQRTPLTRSLPAGNVFLPAVSPMV
jgi:hypothetical protein